MKEIKTDRYHFISTESGWIQAGSDIGLNPTFSALLDDFWREFTKEKTPVYDQIQQLTAEIAGLSDEIDDLQMDLQLAKGEAMAYENVIMKLFPVKP